MAEEQLVPTIGISFKTMVADGKEVVFQTFVEREIPPKALNALLDKLRGAVDHQISFSKLDKIEGDLEYNERMRSQLSAAVEAVDQLYREKRANGPIRMTSAEELQEKSERKKAMDSLRHHDHEIARLRNARDDMKAMLCPSQAPKLSP